MLHINEIKATEGFLICIVEEPQVRPLGKSYSYPKLVFDIKN